jgi:hypothetical protein
VARSGCIYGSTGSRKTTQVKFFAHYIAATTGKATALLSLDGGGWGPCQPEVDAGMIEPFFCDPSVVPLPTIRRISQGYWPRDVNVPADQVDLARMDFQKFGGVAVEGWTSIGAVGMRFLPDKGINVGGEDRSKLGGFEQQIRVDGSLRSEVLRSNTRGDFGFIQNYLFGIVMNFNSLPVRYILYTALESKTEDDDRTTIFGPAIAGKKATAQCGSWIGDLIHAQDYSTTVKRVVPDPSDAKKTIEAATIEATVRFYWKKHPDPSTGILFPAKPRVTPERYSELESAYPHGYFESDVAEGFDRYLHTVDRLAATQADQLKGWREKADQKLRGTAPAAATTSTK